MGRPLVDIAAARVVTPRGQVVLDDVSLTIVTGERVALLGPSGAGKTTLGRLLLGGLAPGLRFEYGTVHVDDIDVVRASRRTLRALRRAVVGWLPQNPAASLTPTMRVEQLVTELGSTLDRSVAVARLAALDLPTDAAFLRRFPRQLSGGQQQRLAIARVLAADPKLLVLDEPATGLDAHTRDTVLHELDVQARVRGLTLLVITHDHAIAETLAERNVRLEHGRIRSKDPCHPVTLTRAHPTAASVRLRRPGPVVLTVEHLCVGYQGSTNHEPVIDDLSFTIAEGEAIALVGPSGAGKTTVARALVGLHPLTRGKVTIDQDELPTRVRDRSTAQRSLIQYIPQDPGSSLNPRQRVRTIITRPQRLLHRTSRSEIDQTLSALLHQVGLNAEIAQRRPRYLSGGEAQRIAIARALAAEPRVLICDEITSALDHERRAAILDLLDTLRNSRRLAIIVITHDSEIVRTSVDREVRLI